MANRIHVLRNEADYAEALAELDRHFENEPQPGSVAGDRFELLVLLVEKYEDETFPMPKVDAVEAVLFAMERKGMDQSDLARLLGSRSRASEILTRKRSLSTEQMRLLASEWAIPAAALLTVPEHA